MNVVFLAGAYYPNFEAVGYCAYQVHKCLSANHDLTVISLRNDAAQPWTEDIEGIHIRRVETVSQRWRNRLNGKTRRHERMLLQGLRIWGAARRLLLPTTVDWSLVRAYVRQLQALETPPQVIVPLVLPFEAALAALEFTRKHPETRLIPYVFDNFVDSESLSIFRWNKTLKRRAHLKLERRLLQKASHVLSMHSLRTHYEASFPAQLNQHITYLEHPLLINNFKNYSDKEKKLIKLCYTGSLIKKLREPDYLIKLLKDIKIDKKIEAHFFVMGSDAAKIKTGRLKSRVELFNHGRVRKDEADKAMSDANVLLSLGATNFPQLSSKIFEYIGTGLPIIHIALTPQDGVIDILKKYPIGLSLYAENAEFSSNSSQLSQFLLENAEKRVSWSEVSSIYPEALPGTTAAVFERLLQTSC
jgi:glycosyltransferase involved in cell wall biosynthesis